MARQKKPVHRVQMTDGKRNVIRQLLEEYDIETAEDIQDVLKDLLGGTIKEMMEAEMDDHLGYEKSERSDNDDYRNGYKHKQVNSRYGSSPVGYLEGIFVLEEYKKRGYAKELLGECQNWAKDQGCLEFASDCELDNEDSLKFHLKMGLAETNRIICFTKRLTDLEE